MRKRRYMEQSIFICPGCGKQIPLMRKGNRPREKWHIKDIWCPFCKMEQKFMEIRHGDWYTDVNGSVIY